MKGWKVWAAALCLAGMGGLAIIDGNIEYGVNEIVMALAMVGIGHKIEKLGLPRGE